MPQLPAALPGQLLQWYDENRRILPWREKPSPYRTWISEVMLQQTSVSDLGRNADIVFVAEIPEHVEAKRRAWCEKHKTAGK